MVNLICGFSVQLRSCVDPRSDITDRRINMGVKCNGILEPGRIFPVNSTIAKGVLVHRDEKQVWRGLQHQLPTILTFRGICNFNRNRHLPTDYTPGYRSPDHLSSPLNISACNSPASDVFLVVICSCPHGHTFNSSDLIPETFPHRTTKIETWNTLNVQLRDRTFGSTAPRWCFLLHTNPASSLHLPLSAYPSVLCSLSCHPIAL